MSKYKFGIYAYNAALDFIKNVYYKGRGAVTANPALTEIGRKQEMEKLIQHLKDSVWGNDIYASYQEEKEALAERILINTALKPKQPEPKPDDIIMENRAAKQILTKLTMVENVSAALAVLRGVRDSGSLIDRTALIVNFGDVIKAINDFLGNAVNKAAITPDLWSDSGAKLGDKIPAATDAANKAQLMTVLKKLFQEVQETLLTDKDRKWQEQMDELINENSKLDGMIEMAKRLFDRFFQVETGTNLLADNTRKLDIWEVVKQKQQDEDEFITAARNAGHLTNPNIHICKNY